MFLPLFPLELVVFPGEERALHIFEPRYQQLIAECLENRSTFGIPPAMEGGIAEYGTEVEVVQVYRKYESGESDILTRGVRVFQIEEVMTSVPDKLYAGATITFVDNVPEAHPEIHLSVFEKYKKLLRVIGETPQVTDASIPNLSFLLAPQVGLSLDEKVRLLSLTEEANRLTVIGEHIDETLPLVEEKERIVKKIQGNGHFKDFPELKE